MNNTYFNKDIFPDIPMNKNNINQNIKLNIPTENLYLENIINQNKIQTEANKKVLYICLFQTMKI